jgi:hypothetical protein
MHPGDKGGDNSPSLQSWTSPQEICGRLLAEIQDSEADSVDSCPKAKPQEQRGLTLYTLVSRLQKQKAKSNPYMVIFNFIGYFILVLCDFPLSNAM